MVKLKRKSSCCYKVLVMVFFLIFSNIIADMKVGKHPNARSPNRPANQIRFDDDGRGYTHDRGVVNEFDAVRRR